MVLLRRRDGGYWRSDSQGYTDDIADAGLYSRSMAEAICRAAVGHSDIVEPDEALTDIAREIHLLDQRERRLIALRDALTPGAREG